MKIEKFENYFKAACIGLLAIFLYFFIPTLQSIPFNLQGIDMNDVPMFIRVAYAIIFETVLMLIIIILFNKKLKKDFTDIKKNHKEYFSKYLKFWLLGILIMMISNLLIMVISGSDVANNEQSIRDLFDISPIYVFFSAVIFAPVVEELIFRQSIRNIIPNKIIFILISGLVFGSLHVIGDYRQLSDLLYLIPYSAPGLVFAYILSKTDNIFVPMGLHFMHNGILIALQFFVLFFG